MSAKKTGRYYRKTLKHPLTGARRDVYGKTRAELTEKCEALQAAWAEDILDAESPYFYQYAADWYARLSGGWTKPRRAEIAREINNVICPVIGHLRLREITSDHCLDVMKARAGMSRGTQEKTLQVLRRILQAAEQAGQIPKDPTRGLKAGGPAPKEKDALTPEQQRTLLEAVRGTSIELFVKIGLYAGLRREEILGLAWKDVHLDAPAPYLDVRQALRWPANNRPEVTPVLKSAAAWRSVPLPAPLEASLRQSYAETIKSLSGPLSASQVIGKDGKPWSYQSFRKAWRAVEVRTAGTVKLSRKDPKTGEPVTVEVERRIGDTVPRHPGVRISIDFPVSPHLLRHTYITRLILGGVDVRRVQYLAGHETASVTLDIYTHLMAHRPEDLLPDVSSVFPG